MRDVCQCHCSVVTLRFFVGELYLCLVVHNLYGYGHSLIWLPTFGYGLVAHMVNKAKGWEEVIMFG
jgi:hypothetical protein